MSKITNDGLIRSGTRCFIALLIWQPGFISASWRFDAVRQTGAGFYPYTCWAQLAPSEKQGRGW